MTPRGPGGREQRASRWGHTGWLREKCGELACDGWLKVTLNIAKYHRLPRLIFAPFTLCFEQQPINEMTGYMLFPPEEIKPFEPGPPLSAQGVCTVLVCETRGPTGRAGARSPLSTHLPASAAPAAQRGQHVRLGERRLGNLLQARQKLQLWYS